MIPKIIHYCWFGGKDIPSDVLQCINSWKKHLPTYKIMRWSEESFDINSVQYVREAYESKKYAFVSDYVRLYALYNFGGVYFDTDVEVLKPLDAFLVHRAFSGFEDEHLISTAIIGSEKNGDWVKIQLDSYENRVFIKPNGELDTTTNVATITNNMVMSGFILNNKRQNFKDLIEVYPKDYFSPKSYITGKIDLTNNTYTIHHFKGSWLSFSQKSKILLRRLLGKKCFSYASKIFKRIF